MDRVGLKDGSGPLYHVRTTDHRRTYVFNCIANDFELMIQ